VLVRRNETQKVNNIYSLELERVRKTKAKEAKQGYK